MPDPGEADLARFQLGIKRTDLFSNAWGEEGWNEDLGHEIALVPAVNRLQPHFHGTTRQLPRNGFDGGLGGDFCWGRGLA